ncbi:MAG: hypothetical protein DCC73_08975 [Proteobacteria bacterium]|nr:MAG: hypothetical protein DCC73_08975 [Pseudomonadota bacterium]
MTDERLSLQNLVRGAVVRVQDALLHHAAIAYLYILPALGLVMSDAFDAALLILLRRPPEDGVGLATALYGLAVLFWGAFIMTSWYRLSLLGPAEYLKIDFATLIKRTGRFLLYGIGIALMAVAVFYTVIAVFGLIATATGSAGQGLAATIGTPIAVASSLAIALRFLPALAGAALGRAVGMGDAWRLTTGHSSRIIAAALMLLIPVLLLSGLVEGGLTQVIFGPLDKDADNATALAWIKGSMLITIALAPLSGAANALLTAVAAELYARLVGPPLDARGMEV